MKKMGEVGRWLCLHWKGTPLAFTLGAGNGAICEHNLNMIVQMRTTVCNRAVCALMKPGLDPHAHLSGCLTPCPFWALTNNAMLPGNHHMDPAKSRMTCLEGQSNHCLLNRNLCMCMFVGVILLFVLWSGPAGPSSCLQLPDGTVLAEWRSVYQH